MSQETSRVFAALLVSFRAESKEMPHAVLSGVLSATSALRTGMGLPNALHAQNFRTTKSGTTPLRFRHHALRLCPSWNPPASSTCAANHPGEVEQTDRYGSTPHAWPRSYTICCCWRRAVATLLPRSCRKAVVTSLSVDSLASFPGPHRAPLVRMTLQRFGNSFGSVSRSLRCQRSTPTGLSHCFSTRPLETNC